MDAQAWTDRIVKSLDDDAKLNALRRARREAMLTFAANHFQANETHQRLLGLRGQLHQAIVAAYKLLDETMHKRHCEELRAVLKNNILVAIEEHRRKGNSPARNILDVSELRNEMNAALRTAFAELVAENQQTRRSYGCHYLAGSPQQNDILLAYSTNPVIMTCELDPERSGKEESRQIDLVPYVGINSLQTPSLHQLLSLAEELRVAACELKHAELDHMTGRKTVCREDEYARKMLAVLNGTMSKDYALQADGTRPMQEQQEAQRRNFESDRTASLVCIRTVFALRSELAKLLDSAINETLALCRDETTRGQPLPGIAYECRTVLASATDKEKVEDARTRCGPVTIEEYTARSAAMINCLAVDLQLRAVGRSLLKVSSLAEDPTRGLGRAAIDSLLGEYRKQYAPKT